MDESPESSRKIIETHVAAMVLDWCQDLRPNTKSLLQEAMRVFRGYIERGDISEEELGTIVKLELPNQLKSEVLRWYRDVPTHQPLRDYIAVLATKAVLDGHMGLHELTQLVSSPEAQRVLRQRIDLLITEIFDEFKDRPDSGNSVPYPHIARVTVQIEKWLSNIKRGETVAGFMRGLIGRECFGENQFGKESLKAYLKRVGAELFVYGLVDAAKDKVREVYHTYLTDDDSPEVLQRHVRFLLDDITAKNGVEIAVDGVVPAIDAVARNLLGSSLSARKIVLALNEDAEKFPRHAALARELRERLDNIVVQISREDLELAERGLDPDWLASVDEQLRNRHSRSSEEPLPPSAADSV